MMLLLPLLSSPVAGAWLPGDGVSLKWRGYYKDLLIRSSSFFSHQTVSNDLKRFRLQSDAAHGSSLYLEAIVDNELYIGSLVNTPDFQFALASQRSFLVDATWEVADENGLYWQTTIYRGFAQVYTPLADCTLGRQRIAWGTGLIWNPTDLLNPINPIQLERSERLGVDAARVEVPLGITSKLDLVFAPQKRTSQSSTAARIRTNLANYDIAVMGGRFRESTVMGFDWSGAISGAGFHGEGTFTFAQEADDFFRFVIGGEYSFRNGPYVFGEFLYNGQGASRKEDYDISLLLSGEPFGLAQLYSALGGSYDVTPLWKSDLYVIVNWNDGSYLFGPTLSYSLSENVDLAAGTYFFRGEPETELGSLANIYFAQFQWFF